MTLKFGFYDSVNGDRSYSANDMNDMFSGIIQDGIIKSFMGELKVIANNTQSQVRILPGKAWLNNTWTLLDSDYLLTLPRAHSVRPRYDAVVLKIDKTSRTNSITYKSGPTEPAASYPVLSNTSTVKEYPLAYIYRPANTNSISNSNITDVRGGEALPWAKSLLMEPFDSVPEMHRTIFRGKYLGTQVTQMQYNTIKSGTFNDLYIGDYWIFDGKKCYVADLNPVSKVAVLFYDNLNGPLTSLKTPSNTGDTIWDLAMRWGSVNRDSWIPSGIPRSFLKTVEANYHYASLANDHVNLKTVSSPYHLPSLNNIFGREVTSRFIRDDYTNELVSIWYPLFKFTTESVVNGLISDLCLATRDSYGFGVGHYRSITKNVSTNTPGIGWYPSNQLNNTRAKMLYFVG